MPLSSEQNLTPNRLPLALTVPDAAPRERVALQIHLPRSPPGSLFPTSCHYYLLASAFSSRPHLLSAPTAPSPPPAVNPAFRVNAGASSPPAPVTPHSPQGQDPLPWTRCPYLDSGATFSATLTHNPPSPILQ